MGRQVGRREVTLRWGERIKGWRFSIFDFRFSICDLRFAMSGSLHNDKNLNRRDR